MSDVPNLYVAEETSRKISRQNATSASSFSIPIEYPQTAYIYLASDAKITDAHMQDLAGPTYLNAKCYQIIAQADLSSLEDCVPTLSGTFKLNISQTKNQQTENTKLYVADDISRKIARQRSAPASSYSIEIEPLGGKVTTKYPYIAVIVFTFSNSSTFIEDETSLRNVLNKWTKASEDFDIDTAAILGYFDSTDKDDFTNMINANCELTLTGTNRLGLKATTNN